MTAETTAKRHSRDAGETLRERGGDRIECLKQELDRAETLVKERADRLDKLMPALQVLGPTRRGRWPNTRR